jgi:prolyl oligopeptidase
MNLGAVFLALAVTAPVVFAYPATPVHPVTDTYYGKAVHDPYRWLEDASDPAVKKWAATQSKLTLAYLHAQPSYPIYAARVAALAKTSTNRFALQIAGGHYVYLRQTPPQQQAQLVTRTGIHGDERILFDPQSAAVGNAAPPAIESVYLSFDGGKVAVTTQQGGAENETIHVIDTVTGELLPDTIANVGGGTSPTALVWDGDGNGFLHTKWPLNPDGTVSSAHIEIWHHVLGTDAAADTYVFGRGLSARAEYNLLGSRDGKYQAAFVTDGDGVHGAIYERASDGTFVQAVAPADAVGSSGDPQCAFVGDRLVVISFKRSTFGEAVAISPGKSFDEGETIVPAGKLVLQNIIPVRGGFLTSEIDGGDGAMRFFRSNGTRARLPIPAQSTITAAAGDAVNGDTIVGFTGYGTPNAWLLYHAGSNTLTQTGIRQRAAADYSQLVVRRALVPSLDGKVKIPVEVVSLPDAKQDGTAPTMLSAYGAYGIVTQPFFIGTRLAFLERGGVFAQAMIRGGGEYGEAWANAAKLATKTKSSDDLAAVADWLGTHGYGNAKHLGIMGGSAGGFLMGLALTRNPARYRAVDSAVGFYDLLREENTPNGAYNTPEFGTTKDPAQFAWMVKQSPYENVVRGKAYPAVLMTTGENDPRVDPYNSRKMVARLQAASTSRLPILLWQKSGEGHGIGNSFAQRIADTTATLTWFDSQLR